MTHNKYIALLICLFFLDFSASAQDLENSKKAESLQLSYQFPEAISIYKSILKQGSDTLTTISIQDKIIQCENGISLLEFSTSPKVVASKGVLLSDFFLYFSQLKDHSWIDIPNPLVKRGEHKYYKAVYFPKTSKKIYFSAPNKSGSWNIYETELIQEILWSEPKPILNLASSGDEIFPILSTDGKKLYFASNGHYGMGGYDLYVSKWDESLNEWSIPENLGFPYSSTGDDLFYMNTPDGKFSMLASNRGMSSRDSIGIYVTKFSPTPIKTAISDISTVREIAKLSPPIKPAREKPIEQKADENISEYSLFVAEMRSLQATLGTILTKQKEDRGLFNTLTSEPDKKFLQEIITEREEESIEIRLKLDKAAKDVQEAEMEFLVKGIIPVLEDPSLAMTKKDEPKEKTLEYSFHKLNLGVIRNMEIEVPIPKFDYTFKILDKSVFAENQALPNTLVYQVQVSVTARKASLNSFRGLSPVFEKKMASGKYLYTVGLFYDYTTARAALSKVARKGFQKAFLIAFNKGKSIPLKNARALEVKLRESMTYQILLRNYPDGISTPIIAAIKESCDKDIAKTYHDGEIVYIVGPFEKESDANYVIKILSGLGIKGASLEPVKL